MGRINVFWHVCGINHWREIAKEQHETMGRSGLLDRAESVRLTFLGDPGGARWLEGLDKKITLDKQSRDTRHYERMCLNSLWDWSQRNDSLVLYLHAKGVSRTGDNRHNVQGWRRMLEYFLVENHERCVREMEEVDTLGGNLCVINREGDPYRPGHGLHYSGNFWWARTSHVRKLTPIPENVDMSKDGNYIRYTEYWVLSPSPKMAAGVLFKTRGPHYYDVHPESDYKERGWL